jgi:hypothetical protein
MPTMRPLALLSAFLLAAEATAQESTNLVSTPWHLADLYWFPESVVTCETFSVDVAIEGQVPAEIPFYIAPLGGGEGVTICGLQCYGGMQTQPDGGEREGRHVRPLGEPGFIFSRWGDRSFDGLRMSDRGACQSSGHEGDFISVRVRHPWATGKFTFHWRGMDRDDSGGKAARWVGLFVYDHAQDREAYVGAIKFPGEKIVLGKMLTSFVEVYGSRIPADRVPQVAITIGNHRADGNPIIMSHARVIHDCQKRQPVRARVSAVERSAVRIETGKPEFEKQDGLRPEGARRNPPAFLGRRLW